MPVCLDILLSTYNGEDYLADQIDSLLSQEFQDWRLLIRDDGSTDRTLDIVAAYSALHPDKILLIDDRLGNLGPAGSFSALMQQSTASYVAFCDQDDIWMPDKLSIQMQRMRDAEQDHAPSCPILIHSDLVVVDAELNELSNSFWQRQKLNPRRSCRVNNLLMQNFVTGCTCLLNRSLVDSVGTIPKNAIMHDWWVALIAVLNGKIVSMPESTVLYRQHSRNDVGAIQWGFKYIVKQSKRGSSSIRMGLSATRQQAKELLNLDLFTESDRLLLKRYCDMFTSNWLAKRITIMRYNFSKYGWLRRIATLVCI